MMDMEEENRETETCRMRIFVGGLGEGVTADDLRRLFGTLGSVDGVEMVRTKGRGFAYVDFTPSPTDQKSLAKLFSKYNGCLWKGGKLKLEKAKEHYLVRLKREWEEDAKLVSDQPAGTSPDSEKSVSSKEMPSRESLKTKQLRIFFPRLRKVKSVPFLGTGKHKYSFPKVEVPPLPVHFCDCEEHSSPTGTVRGKQFYNEEPERGGMNDEEINIMNAVMNKLFEKEKLSSPMQYENEQNNSHESPDDLQSDEYEVDSATDDDDDLIINVETKKKKTALIGSEELVRILGNQESGLKEARNFEEEANKNKLEVKKHKNIASDKKRKSLSNLEEKNNGCTTSTSGGKRHMQKLLDETSSEVQTTELGDGFREPTKVSWSQKSSWRELLGGNVAFNTSHILPSSNSSEEEQRSADSSDAPKSPNTKTQSSEEEQGSDSSDAPESPNTKTQSSEEEQGSDSSDALKSPKTKTEHMEMEGEEQGFESSDAPESPNTNTQSSEEEQGSDSSDALKSPNTKTEHMEMEGEEEQGSDSSYAPESPNTETELMEMEGGGTEKKPLKTEVVEEGLAETQPTKKNAPLEQWGRGAAWKQKQSWTQLVGQHNSFSISQILPESTFQKSDTKEPIMDFAISSDCKQNDLAKDTNNACVGDDGLNLVKNSLEKKHNESVGDGCKLVKSTAEENQHVAGKEAKETQTRDITVSETCSFMRSAASLREWAKTKAALSVSLKRKRTEKEH